MDKGVLPATQTLSWRIACSHSVGSFSLSLVRDSRQQALVLLGTVTSRKFAEACPPFSAQGHLTLSIISAARAERTNSR